MAQAALTANSVILQTGNGQNLVSWPIITSATSYVVQRSIDGVNWTTVATLSGNPLATHYTDSAVLIGVAYFYQVAASTASGNYVASAPANITPCLPGQIPLGYLRYHSKLRSDMKHSKFLTDDEWNFNLNQQAFELRDILTSAYGEDYFMAPPLQIPLTGLQAYPLPDGSNYQGSLVNGAWVLNPGGTPAAAHYKLNGVDANVSGASTGPNAGWIPLSRSNWSDRDRYTTWPGQAGALNNIYQMSYREMGNNIFFFPMNTNMLVQLWYVPIMVQMLLDTDMLPFSMSGWSEYVIVSTAILASNKEESFDLVTKLEGQKMALLTRIETMAANRDVGQPNTVSNVRSTMGDPGFSDWGNGFGAGGFGGSGGGYAAFLVPSLLKNDLGYHTLSNSIFTGQGFLSYLPWFVLFAYLAYLNFGEFCGRITLSGTTEKMRSRSPVATLRNHVSRIFKRRAEK